MANYVCSVRSNYVHVKDQQAFEEFIERFECEPIYDKEGRMGFYCQNMDGCSPYIYDEDLDEHFDLMNCAPQIGRHLCEGEVLVVEEVGSEKMRYLCGHTYAVNDKGETLFVDMSTALRNKVETEWGKADYTEATY